MDQSTIPAIPGLVIAAVLVIVFILIVRHENRCK